uniref:Hydrolase n=1 Tax=Podoviridae sp. ctcKt3 TaxID=2826566 RepID=A0A8S5N7X2_9CAUD|nr:MAG TPA: hydrolase [Podoviridae sp. ctcKt3]
MGVNTMNSSNPTIPSLIRPVVPTSVPFTYRDGLTMLQLIECLKHNLDRLQEYVNGVMDNVNKALKDQTTQNQDTLDKAQQAVQDAADAVRQAQNALGQYQNIVDSVNNAITTANSAIDRLEALGVTDPEAATELKNTIQQTAIDLAALTERVTTAEGNITELRTKGTEIENNLTNTTSMTQINKADIAGINANLDALHANTVSDAENLYNTVQKLDNSNHLVIIGDSFSTSAREDVWWANLPENCKHLEVHNYAVGGTGFIQDSGTNPGNTFTQQIDKAIADETFPNDRVSHVIIYGGYNDWAYGKTAEDEKSAVRAAYMNAVSNFPNANVILCFGNIGMANGVKKYNTWKNWVKAVQGSLYTNGVPFVQSDLWLAGYTPVVFEGDELHPNNIGEGIICSHMAALIMGWQTSGERLIIQKGDSSTMNYVEMWYNDLTGIVSLYGKQSPANSTATGQQMLLDLGGYPPIIGDENNPLFGCAWYMSGAQAGKVRSVCFSPVNKRVYINISEEFTNPSTLAVYFNCHYHV